MKDNHKEEITRLIAKGDENLAAARASLEQGYLDAAVSRAYYCMFYYAQALLLTQDLRYSRHSGVIAGVGEHFVKFGKLKPEIQRLLVDAFELRGTGDYDYMTDISRKDAEQIIQDAARFIKEITPLLKTTS